MYENDKVEMACVPNEPAITLKSLEELHAQLELLEIIINNDLSKATDHFRKPTNAGIEAIGEGDKKQESRVKDSVDSATNKVCRAVRDIRELVQLIQ